MKFDWGLIPAILFVLVGLAMVLIEVMGWFG